VDAQSFWSRLALSDTKQPNVNEGTTKATKEAITIAPADDVSLSGELLLSGFLDDLLATPEGQRRISKSAQSSRVPSLEPQSTSGVLPFDSVDAVAGYGFGDLGPWESSADVERSFKHGFSVGDLEVPMDIAPRPAAKKARIERRKRLPMLIFDKEALLEREELLLATDEGLLPKVTFWEHTLQKIFHLSSPLTSLKNPKKSTKQPAIEDIRGLASGVMDWDPYDAPSPAQVPMGVGISASSSIGGGISPMARNLGISVISRSTSSMGSPNVNQDWNAVTQISNRRESMDLLA
jgi:hypothetical protein